MCNEERHLSHTAARSHRHLVFQSSACRPECSPVKYNPSCGEKATSILFRPPLSPSINQACAENHDRRIRCNRCLFMRSRAHHRLHQRRDDETNYSRLRMAIGRNQEAVTKFQDRQICTSVAGVL